MADACSEDAQGLLEGSYHVRVQSASDDGSFDIEAVRASGDPPVRTVLVGDDDEIDVDADVPTGQPACVGTPAG